MKMISVYDERDQKAIRRGEKGVRGKRPTPERFLDSAGIDVGKFRAVQTDWNGCGGNWLGDEYMKWRKDKPYTIRHVIDGIKA